MSGESIGLGPGVACSPTFPFPVGWEALCRPWVIGVASEHASSHESPLPDTAIGKLRVPYPRHSPSCLSSAPDQARLSIVDGRAWRTRGRSNGGGPVVVIAEEGAAPPSPRDFGHLDATAVHPGHYHRHALSERVGPESGSGMHACTSG